MEVEDFLRKWRRLIRSKGQQFKDPESRRAGRPPEAKEEVLRH